MQGYGTYNILPSWWVFISKDITCSKSNISFLFLIVNYNAVAYFLEVFVCVCVWGGEDLDVCLLFLKMKLEIPLIGVKLKL